LLYSLDCGITWTVFWQDGGLSLSTAPPPAVFSEFVPDSSQWEIHIISLNQFLGAPLLALKFENKNGWGNDLYVDNINLSIPTQVGQIESEEISIYPNPVAEKLNIRNLVPTGMGIISKSAFNIAVYNMIGEKIISENGRLTVDCRLLLPGVYILELNNGSHVFRTKFIKE